VLVTGGAGFVGSHIVGQLVDEGHEVVIVDSIEPDAHREAPEVSPDVELRAHSVCDLDAMLDAVEGCDAICHQAAKVGLGVDFSDVDSYVHHNDVGTATVLRAMHERTFTGRYVFASSMVVYGEGAYQCADHGPVRPGPRDPAALAAGRYESPCPYCGQPLDSITISESAPLSPRNVYAATKLHQEHLAEVFALEHPDVVTTALRYHNVYGPRMPRDTPYAGVASIFRSALARGEPPCVFEDGGQRRDFVHVVDVARANVLALTGPRLASGPFNIASGAPHTILEMAEAIADAAGEDAPRPEVVGGFRAGDVRHVVASPARARTELGFTAEIEFRAGMQELASAELRA
jgi:dTDP-L-rhamnose 4-epimerase